MFLRDIPVRRINFKDSSDKALHDLVVKNVKKIEKIYDDMTPTLTEITKIEEEIDVLVFQIYNLAENEITFIKNT